MNTNNFAQKTNYTAGSSALDLTNLFLTSLSIPGITLSHPEISSGYGSKLNLGGDSLAFSALSLTLLIDEDFLIYQEFMSKIFNYINPENNTFASIEFDFWININNSKGNSLFRVEFSNCRLSNIGEISLDSQSDETEISLSVEITYDYYKIITPSSVIIPTLHV